MRGDRGDEEAAADVARRRADRASRGVGGRRLEGWERCQAEARSSAQREFAVGDAERTAAPILRRYSSGPSGPLSAIKSRTNAGRGNEPTTLVGKSTP